jgi:transcriptional regulator with XRE-family HTH domain
MADIYRAFGGKVRDRRKSSGLSQEELAFKIGRDPRSIVAIEGGNRNPTLATIHKLCQALKVKSSDLLNF